MSAVNEPAWYAIWTKSRHEQVVKQQLEEKGLEVFLPTFKRWSRWKDRKKLVVWPLFPGYCFAKFSAEQRLSVLTCTGAVSIVSFDGAPAPIPESELYGIRQLVESELVYDPCPLIHEGDRVQVAHGPLKGVVGILVRKGSNARLVLTVNLIGQGASVEVDAADVKAY